MKNWSHTLIAIFCVVLAWVFGASAVGAVAAAGFFVGREHAQAEYRWIEYYGAGKRANLKFLDAFDARVWDVHSWFWNLLLPVGAAVLLYFALVHWSIQPMTLISAWAD